MSVTSDNSFHKVTTRPNWEGIIFTGLDFSDQRISISEALPTEELKDHIEYIWFMEWALAESESLPCILAPNPCAKLVMFRRNDKPSAPVVFGTNKEAKIFKLQGSGASVGFDFKPGALFNFLGKPMTTFPEEGIPAEDLFKIFPQALVQSWTEKNLSKWVQDIQIALSSILAAAPENHYKQIAPLIDKVLKGSFGKPEDMATNSGISLRSLQRIFQKEIGVSPRDLLRMNRFNEAIRRISGGDFKEFVDVALESGFFDQPHMAHEFKKLVDSEPSKFRRYL